MSKSSATPPLKCQGIKTRLVPEIKRLVDGTLKLKKNGEA